MNGSEFSESVVEQAALAWVEGLGYEILVGPAIAAGEPTAERVDANYRETWSWSVDCIRPSCNSIPICPPRRSTTPFGS